jgi:hypothetical protein
MEIRSFRRVFDLERRIYRVDRLRLNPGGVPVRGVVYFLAVLAGVLVIASLPGLAIIAGLLPWYVRYLALPGVSAAILAVIRIEGRPFHVAAYALVRYRAAPRTLAGLCSCASGSGAIPGERWRPEPILMLPDGSDSGMRQLRYSGPGAVLIAVAHRCEPQRGIPELLGRRPELIVRALPAAPDPPPGEVVVLERGTRLRVR